MAAITPARPSPYPQGDGSRYQWLNCVLAVCTMLMHRASMGRWRVPAWRLRALTNDTVGGVTHLQAQAAVDKATGGVIELLARYGINRSQLYALVRAGHTAGIPIDCSVTVRTSRRTNWFTGSHEIFLVDVRTTTSRPGSCRCELDSLTSHGEFLVEDPGTTSTGYLWWSASLIYRAAEAQGGGGVGANVINALVCRDTEDVDRVARIDAAVRAAPRGDSKRLGRLAAGKTYHVRRTLHGAPWVNDLDGKERVQWAELAWGGGLGYVRGEGFRS